ncbi:MAG: polyketide synthase, partial [Thermohalobaculum sp.]|nr:polyketide synthase [Thermohalobaculum sp.]
MTPPPPCRGIAIVGMACRFPGANDLDAFWRNLRAGIDSIRHFSDAELMRAGIPEAQVRRPDYVKAAPVIDGFDLFDAEFFEYSPREARLMDPQQRILLEEAWHALEDAGHPPGRGSRRVGAFMGSGGVVTSYLLAHAALHTARTGGIEHLANDKDFLSTKLSYKLDLTGPSINVQTACSTSMVAVHLACQSILDGECDMALAGASTLRVPQIAGYQFRQGDILSPDGRCRAYDADAQGTVFGSGTGVVVLKHVEDAIADGDRIYAVILGSAVNNDGGAKVSYTASSTEGQARAMAEAFAAADVAPSTIGYVEGHGTGTVVGDPLEVEALRRCFATDPDTRPGGCHLGSVKTNIGHLEQAAGVASLIKTALALHHRVIPPSLNFERPNPRIDFAGGPFRIPTADVSVTITSLDTSEGTVSPSAVTFTPANWNGPQTVTVTGVEDSVDDGDLGYTIVTAEAVSADLPYQDLDAADVAVTNR